ncbi:MAG: hypothetical protein GY938_30735 [Ketobacter sp.]|nr:hypothetical protein [Ketobacter sp.]
MKSKLDQDHTDQLLADTVCELYDQCKLDRAEAFEVLFNLRRTFHPKECKGGKKE